MSNLKKGYQNPVQSKWCRPLDLIDTSWICVDDGRCLHINLWIYLFRELIYLYCSLSFSSLLSYRLHFKNSSSRHELFFDCSHHSLILTTKKCTLQQFPSYQLMSPRNEQGKVVLFEVATVDGWNLAVFQWLTLWKRSDSIMININVWASCLSNNRSGIEFTQVEKWMSLEWLGHASCKRDAIVLAKSSLKQKKLLCLFQNPPTRHAFCQWFYRKAWRRKPTPNQSCIFVGLYPKWP